jgi:hypothetical protein
MGWFSGSKCSVCVLEQPAVRRVLRLSLFVQFRVLGGVFAEIAPLHRMAMVASGNLAS